MLKALRLVEFIDESGLFVSPNVNLVANLGPEGWDMIAAEAGERVPSEQTVAMIVGIYAQRALDKLEL